MALDTGRRSGLGEQAAPARRPRPRRGVPVTVVVLALVAITLMLVDVGGGPTHYLRTAGGAIGGPVQRWAAGVLGALPADPAARQDAGELARENDELRRHNAELQVRVDRLEQRLASAADPDPIADLPTVAATVVAADARSRATVTVAAGSIDGVAADSAALVDGFLVGRVVSVSPTTASVQLISDPASSVAVRLRGSRETALLVGVGDPNRVPMNLVDPLVALEPGEQVVTIGSQREVPFPAGLVVGTVAGIDAPVGSAERTVDLQPAADLTALDRVDLVLTGVDGAHTAADPS